MLLFSKIQLAVFLVLLTFQSGSQTVFKTPSGIKYHLASCKMVKNVSTEMTVSRALAAGLLPCKICHPSNSQPAMGNSNSKAKGEGKTVQCRGLTKAGNRCRHMTGIANGYCYQHQNQ